MGKTFDGFEILCTDDYILEKMGEKYTRDDNIYGPMVINLTQNMAQFMSNYEGT